MFAIGVFMVILSALAGVIAFVAGAQTSEGPVAGAAILGADFMLLVLLMLLRGVADVRDLLKNAYPEAAQKLKEQRAKAFA
jgi:hypothetical protein